MFYEEKIVFGITYCRTKPNGKWRMVIPEGINKDIGLRWELGIPHHPKSEALYQVLDELDFNLGDDTLSLTSGGDGDNGEHIMYLLDIYFETLDINETNKVGH